MAMALIACVLLFAGASAAAAQIQNYPASPYFSPQAAPKAPSPYYGTNRTRIGIGVTRAPTPTIRTAFMAPALPPVPTG